jgi:hypothetical protein
MPEDCALDAPLIATVLTASKRLLFRFSATNFATAGRAFNAL